MNPDEQKQSVIFLGKHFRRNFSHLNEAEYAFRRKYIYSNNYFKINGNEDTSDQKHNQFILSKYGSKLTAISVESVDLVDGDVESDWLLDSIVENCISLKKLALHFLTADFGKLFSKLPQLTHLSINYLDTYDKDWSRVNLPNLRYVSIKADVRLESHQFAAFIANNPKIEIMELKLHFSPLQGIDGKLNALKHLKICGPDFLANSQIADQVVRLDSLVTLDIDCIDIVRVLQIFRKGCDTIKYLSICSKQIFQRIPLDMEAFLTALGSFGQVRTLAIVNIKLNEQMIKRIGITLQNLSSLSIEMQTGPNIVTEVLSVVPTFRYSHELTIRLDCRMTNSMNYDFHKRFVDAVTKHRSDFKLKLIFRNNDQLIFTNESIMQKKGTSKPIRIHWTGYEAEYSASNVHMFDLRTKHFKTLYDSMDLLSLLQLKLTCHQMQSNVQLYVDDAYQRRTFVCSSNDNMNELHRLLQHFGQYFRYLRIHISSICESTEIFSWINQYCKNVTHMYLLNQSFTTRLIHPVQFELPHLEELVYQADNNIDLEISAFGGCLSLQHLEVRSPGKLDDKVPVSKSLIHILYQSQNFKLIEMTQH